MEEKFTLVDLFTGTGAFSLAFHKTGQVKTIFANDHRLRNRTIVIIFIMSIIIKLYIINFLMYSLIEISAFQFN